MFTCSFFIPRQFGYPWLKRKIILNDLKNLFIRNRNSLISQGDLGPHQHAKRQTKWIPDSPTLSESHPHTRLWPGKYFSFASLQEYINMNDAKYRILQKVIPYNVPSLPIKRNEPHVINNLIFNFSYYLWKKMCLILSIKDVYRGPKWHIWTRIITKMVFQNTRLVYWYHSSINESGLLKTNWQILGLQ